MAHSSQPGVATFRCVLPPKVPWGFSFNRPPVPVKPAPKGGRGLHSKRVSTRPKKLRRAGPPRLQRLPGGWCPARCPSGQALPRAMRRRVAWRAPAPRGRPGVLGFGARLGGERRIGCHPLHLISVRENKKMVLGGPLVAAWGRYLPVRPPPEGALGLQLQPVTQRWSGAI